MLTEGHLQKSSASLLRDAPTLKGLVVERGHMDQQNFLIHEEVTF